MPQSLGPPWETIKGQRCETIKRMLTDGDGSKGHPWETMKGACMTGSQEDKPGKQSSGHSWTPIKETFLGNNQAHIHAQQSKGHPWETIKLPLMCRVHSWKAIKRSFMASKKERDLGTVKRTLMCSNHKDLLGRQLSRF